MEPGRAERRERRESRTLGRSRFFYAGIAAAFFAWAIICTWAFFFFFFGKNLRSHFCGLDKHFFFFLSFFLSAFSRSYFFNSGPSFRLRIFSSVSPLRNSSHDSLSR